jgi:PelA/Pel-15E family pectate lyase
MAPFKIGMLFTCIITLVTAGYGLALSQHDVADKEPALSWRQAMRQSSEWHGSPEALRIAEQVLLYQHDNGGWSKNIDMARPLTDEDRRQVERQKGNSHESTIDNNATIQQMDFLARVYRATGRERYREGVERGLDFLIDAQYPNGGWPQYPGRDRGYHTQITYNDGAMAHVLNRLLDIVDLREPYAFLDETRRRAARSALAKGIECVLNTQIPVDGRLTGWCAQHDRDTLEPAQGRSYEHPSISGAESVGVVRFLMRLEDPSPEIIRSIQSAVAWFEASKLHGIRLQTVSGPEYEHGHDRIVVEDPDAPPIWARFYEIETNRPIFSGRDGVITYDLAEIEHERRNGYSWLGGYATTLIEREYPQWQRRWAPASGRQPATETHAGRVATVLNTPGCVAFWDFVKREPDGDRRFTAHVPPGTTNVFALDAANYVRDYWGEGPEATYADFPAARARAIWQCHPHPPGRRSATFARSCSCPARGCMTRRSTSRAQASR